jgi:hypothetical protein
VNNGFTRGQKIAIKIKTEKFEKVDLISWAKIANHTSTVDFQVVLEIAGPARENITPMAT